MRVLIVITAYNVESFIGATIESVAAQTHTDWRAVVIDDGSTDGSCEAAIRASYKHGVGHKCAVVTGRNNGIGRVRDVGYGRGRDLWPPCDAVIFLDGDDVWEPDALATMVRTLGEHPDVGGAAVLGYTIDEQGRYLNRRGGASPRRVFFSWCGSRGRSQAGRGVSLCDTLAGLPLVNFGAVLIRTEVIESMESEWGHLFDPRLKHCEDLDFALRLTADHQLWFEDKLLLGYRKRAGQQTAKPDLRRWNELVMRRVPGYLERHFEGAS